MMDNVQTSTSNPTGEKLSPALMQKRTRQFACRIIKLVTALPKNRTADVLGRQLLKAGTSIGANYREAQHASSRRQFITTMEIAQREACETLYWLELLADSEQIAAKRLSGLMEESKALYAIITRIIQTSKSHTKTRV
ncbi:MAG: four helix bundle protein [Phycisphaerales bacterium]|nr:four helix bundle protein [Phycisphaerales bacterium]